MNSQTSTTVAAWEWIHDFIPHFTTLLGMWLLTHAGINVELYWLLVQLLVQIDIKAGYHWPFMRGHHQWLVDSPHKEPVMQKMFLMTWCLYENFEFSTGVPVYTLQWTDDIDSKMKCYWKFLSKYFSMQNTFPDSSYKNKWMTSCRQQIKPSYNWVKVLLWLNVMHSFQKIRLVTCIFSGCVGHTVWSSLVTRPDIPLIQCQITGNFKGR